jgi:hypothetical protein
VTIDAVIPDLAAAVAYLFVAYGRTLDDAVGLVYEHQLADIPFALVQAAVIDAPKRHAKPFVPGINELRAICEAIRLERVAKIQHEPCATCMDSENPNPGWTEIVDSTGTKRLDKCGCVKAHLRRIEASGFSRPIALLAASSEDV